MQRFSPAGKFGVFVGYDRLSVPLAFHVFDLEQLRAGVWQLVTTASVQLLPSIQFPVATFTEAEKARLRALVADKAGAPLLAVSIDHVDGGEAADAAEFAEDDVHRSHEATQLACVTELVHDHDERASCPEAQAARDDEAAKLNKLGFADWKTLTTWGRVKAEWHKQQKGDEPTVVQGKMLTHLKLSLIHI